MKITMTALFVIGIVVLAGCSTDSTPPNLVTAIELQPSGILIKVQRDNGSLQGIISNPHFSYSNGPAKMQNFTFTLKNASLGPKLHWGTLNQNYYGTMDVKKKDGDVVVTLSDLDQPYTQWQVGSSQGKYVGIALQYRSYQTIPHPKPTKYTPEWFQKDILIAAFHEGTPMIASDYRTMLPFQTSNKTYSMMAPFVGTEEDVNFTSYFGAISMYENYLAFDTPTSIQFPPMPLEYGKIKERKASHWVAIPYVLAGMENGWSFGFAQNQVIVASEHASFFSYTVYPVAGITIKRKTS